MNLKKFATAAGLAAFTLSGAAFADDSLTGMDESYDSSKKTSQTGSQASAGQHEFQATVKQVDSSSQKVTFEAELAPQAHLKGQDQQQLQLSELKEGDEVRASFDPVNGNITSLEVISKDQKSKEKSPSPAQPSEPSQPSYPEPSGGTTY